tara:strand:- start:1204 stop:2328 length:1125 start_codon:yes stop_codon:yes gene_type:complete
MMNRILKRPMFRMGGRSDDGIMSVRRGYQEGDQVKEPEYKFSETPVAKGLEGLAAYGPNAALAAIADFGAVPLNTLGRAFGYNPGFSGTKLVDALTGGRFSEFTGYDPDTARFLGVPTSAERGFTLPSMKQKDEPPNNIELPPPPSKKKSRDPEKELLDVYAENKGVIDQIMGDSDDATKRQLFLQLAQFGAGLASQPGGDLVGAIGRAAQKPIENVGQVLAQKEKDKKDIRSLALQKSFDDMKEPEQVKFVKAIQREYGLDSFADAYDLVTKSKKSSAEINAENTFYRTTAENMGVSTEGFRREMNKLDDAGLGGLIGEFTRADAALPEDIDDRVNGEYYIRPNGKAVRFVNGKLYSSNEPQFTAEIKATEKK